MENNIIQLNELLFNQLKKLSDDNLTGNELHQEIERAKTMALVGSQCIAGATLIMKKEVLELNKVGKYNSVSGYLTND